MISPAERFELADLHPDQTVHANLSVAPLCEAAIRAGEGRLSCDGALAVETVPYTGRSPQDKFIVRDAASEGRIFWGAINQPFDPERYEALRRRVLDHLSRRPLFVQELGAGAHPAHRIRLRFVGETAWHAWFARTMFLRGPQPEDRPRYTLFHAPSFRAEPARDGTRSEVFIVLNLERREILIGGTAYAGEVKKAVFTLMNDLLPSRGVLSMHCSANRGQDPEDVALFFGLSGTGKTTLSIDPSRRLIGDDEHGWSEDGVFNLEGGCYAKVIRLSPQDEPVIYDAARRFGTLLENVPLEEGSRVPDFAADVLTENTRAAFPVEALSCASPEQVVGHPRVIFFLTADAFGVLPPLARLTPEQAGEHFLLGYTAKIAGTERGVREPQATFSPCFGEPFLPLAPRVYAELLLRKLREHGTTVWLVNTGWSGGPYGVGSRIRLPYTRAMVQAVLEGRLEDVPLEREPHFGLAVPRRVPEVPAELLRPWEAWDDPAAYDRQARQLAARFAARLAELR